MKHTFLAISSIASTEAITNAMPDNGMDWAKLLTYLAVAVINLFASRRKNQPSNETKK